MYSTLGVMVREAILILWAVAIASAAPSNSSQLDRVLSADEMIHYGREGRVEIVRRSEYLMYTGGISIATAEQRYANFTIDPEKELKPETQHKIEKRCKSQKVFTLKPAETYVNWDIAMSDVVLAPPKSSASIAVTEGFHIQNSLGSSPSEAINLIEKFMKNTLGISYGKSWTSSYRSGYTFSIPPGKFGAIVVNPLTTRHSGYVDVGCVGQAKRTEFSGESYRHKKYSGMQWVEGLIGLCVGDTFPLNKCFGEGTL